MVNWVTLCRHTLQAEFPEFETVQAFTAFRLDEHVRMSVFAKNLATLASVLGIDEKKLISQFHDIRPMALRHHESGVMHGVQTIHKAKESRNASRGRRALH